MCWVGGSWVRGGVGQPWEGAEKGVWGDWR